MSGFQEQVWEERPTGRGNLKAKSIWVAFKLATGIPPSLIEYFPPNRWVEGEDSERSWRGHAEWVVHHKMGKFVFKGKAKGIIDRIHKEGLSREE